MNDLDHEDIQRIRRLSEDLAEDLGWEALGMDARQVLADHGLPGTDRAERELRDHLIWLLS